MKATREFLRVAALLEPKQEHKVHISLRLDPDIVLWFREHGERYQTHINNVLRAYIHAKSKA